MPLREMTRELRSEGERVGVPAPDHAGDHCVGEGEIGLVGSDDERSTVDEIAVLVGIRSIEVQHGQAVDHGAAQYRLRCSAQESLSPRSKQATRRQGSESDRMRAAAWERR